MDLKVLESQLERIKNRKQELATELGVPVQKDRPLSAFEQTQTNTNFGTDYDELHSEALIPTEDKIVLESYNHIRSISEEQLSFTKLDQKYLSVQGNSVHSQLPGNRYSYVSLDGHAQLFEPLIHRDKHFKINPDSHYQMAFTGVKDGKIHLDLIILSFSDNRPVGVKCVPFHSSQLLKFPESAEDLKFLIRVQGRGKFAELQIGITEKAKVPVYQNIMELLPKKWFVPKSAKLALSGNDKLLKVKSELDPEKKVYVSYHIRNNSFSKVPEEPAFDVHEGHYYEILVNGEQDGPGMAVPILIGYSATEKVEIIQLEWNKVNRIKFRKSVIACRAAFTVTGKKKLDVTQFCIREFPEIETGGQMRWLDSREVALLGQQGIRELRNMKMAVIFDEFTTHCFQPECEVITFTPENWRETLSATPPDFLMVESAWRGNGGSWVKKVQYTDESSVQDLKALLQWCSEHSIPTIFWNKEDPVHYDHFIETAKLFDFVFTTDVNMVPVYKEACGHDRVDYLQFAAQPAIHNPITIGEREKAVSFAGSYYAKHLERSEDMLRIFNEALPYGLAIYDRNYEKVKQGLLQNNRFPDHLQPYIRGSLRYYEIDKAYKGFRVMINVSTVKHSPTMFARRVYEGLASGTPIISTYSKGIEQIFGDIVSVSENQKEIAAAFKKLFEDEREYRKIAVEGVRRVLKDHTYSHRLEKIAETLELPFKRTEPAVAVLAQAKSADSANKIILSYHKQTYENKNLILIVDDADKGSIEVTDPSITVYGGEEFVTTYQNILELVEAPYLSYISDSRTYNEHHLLDLMLSTKYAPWEIVCVQNGEQLKFEQADKIDNDLSIFKRDLFSVFSTKEALQYLQDSKGHSTVEARGARILAITTK